PFAEALVDGPTERASDRVTHYIVVAARPGWQRADRALDRLAQKGSSRGRRRRFNQPDQTDRGRRHQATPAVKNDGSNRAAVQRNATPVLQRGPAERQQPFAVARQPADRDL